MTPKGIGELAEMEFMLEASRKGLTVCKPFTHFCKYDFIVDNGKRLLRVQVKSTAIERFREDRKSSQFSIMVSHGSSKKEHYTKDQIDVFAIFIGPLKVWYFIPVHAVNACKISLNPQGKQSKYAVFKENWDMITN